MQPYKSEISNLIRQRRSVFPKMYDDRKITDEEIWEVLENANWAPNHKKTEPWRFVVFRGQAKERLGEYMQSTYKEKFTGEQYVERKYKKMMANPLQSSCVIAIILHRDPQERIPEWEELAAVSCAVQNMWLSCHAMGIGSYWSTPKIIIEADQFLELADNEHCLGLFYMGRWNQESLSAARSPISEKVRWYEE